MVENFSYKMPVFFIKYLPIKFQFSYIEFFLSILKSYFFEQCEYDNYECMGKKALKYFSTSSIF